MPADLSAFMARQVSAVAFQAIKIPQDFGWRAVELEIILREAGNCLQPF